MPFDGTKLRVSLAEGVAALGITPIPNSVLESHKQAELAKHPADWWYTHKTLADVLLGIGFFLSLASLVAMIVGLFCMIFTVEYGIWGIVAGSSALVFVGIAYIIGDKVNGTVVRGAAKWEETIYRRNEYIRRRKQGPTEIMEMAQDIIWTVPNCYAVIGELKQDSVTLDPYLLIRDEDTGAQVVIGIWDEDTIIHQAQR